MHVQYTEWIKWLGTKLEQQFKEVDMSIQSAYTNRNVKPKIKNVKNEGRFLPQENCLYSFVFLSWRELNNSHHF